MRRTTWAISAAVFSLGLSACDPKPPEPAPSESLDATPEDAPGITLSQARVQLPVVSGRPGVAYFTLTQANGAPRKLVSVAVEMAGRAEMHESMQSGAMSAMKPVKEVAIHSGETLKFEPGGYHVMLFDLAPQLRFQKQVRLTVAFDNGDKASVPAPVTTMAEAMEEMP